VREDAEGKEKGGGVEGVMRSEGEIG